MSEKRNYNEEIKPKNYKDALEEVKLDTISSILKEKKYRLCWDKLEEACDKAKKYDDMERKDKK